MLLWRRKKSEEGKDIKLFFSTDIHGSNKCFKKFLKAGDFYKVDFLILGGDLTGKKIIPIIKQANGKFVSGFMEQETVMSQEELGQVVKTIEDSGHYPYITDKEGYEELNSKKKREDIFKRLIIERFREWVQLAEKRLKDTKFKVYLTGGNDDPLYVDDILKSDYMINVEGKVVNLDEDYQMISTGYSNITPWNCPRDITEEELQEKIEAMISQVENIESCIFNFHCPPKDTGLDECPRLDKNLKPIVEAGSIAMYGAGSTAVRSVIEKYQPLLGLHGHIHESRGFNEVGKTLCLNPGSEYGEGILRGVIVHLKKRKVDTFNFTSG